MRQLNLTEAIKEALKEEMQRDEKVFCIGEDIQAGTFGQTTGLVQQFGTDRIMDTPLSETAVAGAAVGAAMCGYRPVADFMFSDFMWIAADEIFMKAAKWHFTHGKKVNVPVVFMAAIGGGFKLGPEHSQSPESVVMHTPGLKLAVPSTPYDAKGLMKTAIRDNNPVVYFYPKALFGLTGDVPEEEYTIPFGQADIKREGSDVTIVAIGQMVHYALEAAEQLKNKASIEVIDPRTLEPLDIDTIVESVKKTSRAVVADEDTLRCGVTGEIASQIMEQAFDYLDAPVKRVAAENLPIAGGFLEDEVLPQTKDIVDAIETQLG